LTNGVACAILSDESDIEAILPQWQEMQERLGLAPFTAPLMAMTWWRMTGKAQGHGLFVVLARVHGRLAGLLPLTVQSKKGVRILRLLANDIYYYRRILAESEAIEQALWEHALAHCPFDCASVKNVHEGTAAMAFFSARCGAPFRTTMVHSHDHRDETPDRFLARQSGVFRRRFNRLNKQMEPAGPFSFAIAQDGAAARNDLLDFLFSHKKEWARRKGKDGPLDDPTTAPFFKALVRLTGGEGKGRVVLSCLRHEGRPVAAILNFIEKKAVFAHIVVHDHAFAKISPGVFLLNKQLLWAAEQGFELTNFMEGEESFKQSIATDHAKSHEFLVARSWKGAAYATLYRILTATRRLRRTFFLQINGLKTGLHPSNALIENKKGPARPLSDRQDP